MILFQSHSSNSKLHDNNINEMSMGMVNLFESTNTDNYKSYKWYVLYMQQQLHA